MNVTSDQLFAKIGSLTIENELLRAQNEEHCRKIAELLGELRATKEITDRNGTPAVGQPIEN
jgi:hypothetical protein